MSLNVLKNVLMTSVVTATALGATNVFAESPKYTGDYTIEAMINKYNVVTLGQEEVHENIPEYTYTEATGNVTNFSHIVGPILVEGELGPLKGESWEALALYQRAFGVNMYVQGRVRAFSHDVSSQDGTKPTLYFGSANADLFAYPDWASEGNKPTWWYGNIYNSSLSFYSQHSFEIVDNYVDFKKLYDNIKIQQQQLKKGTVVTPTYVDYSGGKNVIKITYGEYYTIESLEGVDAIVFYGFDQNKDNTTVINLLDAGDSTKSLSMPELLIYENNSYNQFVINALPSMDPNTGEITAEERIRNVIWNIPNAEYISFDLNSAFVGHIIAPQADVNFLDTNYGGCMVANSIHSTGSTGQIYFHPYGNAELEIEEEPTEIVVNVEKRAESVTGKLLAGAKLQLLDKDGKVIEEWTSTEEAYVLKAELTIGETYTIREVSAPEGYELAKDVTITIEDTEDVQVFTVVNVLEPEEIDPPIVSDGEVENPDTGDNVMLYIGIVAGSLVAIISLVVILLKMKKKKAN